MRIWNCKNYEWASLALIPWFVPEGQNPLDMGWELHERLRTKPEETFCAIAIKNNIIQAVLIAYLENDYTWIWQAQARKGFKYAKFVFDCLLAWSKSKGKKILKFGSTKRKGRNLARKYGFRFDGKEYVYVN